MKHLYRNIVAGMIVPLLVVACAGQPPESIPLEERLAERGYTMGEQVKRIRDYRINGWNNVDRYNVIMNVGASKNYLVTVRSPCDGLRSAEHLAFSTTVGALTDKDKLVVRGSGRYLEQCYIDTIHLLEKADKDS
jgi:hypothetical protein